jgi:hypothetical protein
MDVSDAKSAPDALQILHSRQQAGEELSKQELKTLKKLQRSATRGEKRKAKRLDYEENLKRVRKPTPLPSAAPSTTSSQSSSSSSYSSNASSSSSSSTSNSKSASGVPRQPRTAPGGGKGVHYTVSIALPGSIINNAQSKELKTYVAGQIARAACIFNVNEVIVFSETGKVASMEGRVNRMHNSYKHQSQTSDCNVFLARVLEYLECPQYLRKSLFPVHPGINECVCVHVRFICTCITGLLWYGSVYMCVVFLSLFCSLFRSFLSSLF